MASIMYHTCVSGDTGHQNTPLCRSCARRGGGEGSRSVGLSAVLNWVISEKTAIATNVPSRASLDRDHIHMSQ